MDTQDVGEELRANRRAQSPDGLRWADVQEEPAARRLRLVTKLKIWPRPDYPAMVAEGWSTLQIYMLKQVYDGIGNKPPLAAPTEEDLQHYIDAVRAVKTRMMGWLKSEEGRQRLDGLAQNTVKSNTGITPQGPDVIDFLFPLPEGARRRFNREDASTWENWRYAMLLGGNRFVRKIQITKRDVETATAAIKEGWPAPRENWQRLGFTVVEKQTLLHHIVQGTRGGEPVQVAVFQAPGHPVTMIAEKTQQEAETSWGKLKPWLVIDKRGKLAGSAPTQEAGVELARSAATRGPRQRVGETLQPDRIADREGPSVLSRGRLHVSTQQLMDEFGLRGVNFGNWMQDKSASEERQWHVDRAFEALHDLARLVNVDPRKMGFGGQLGLAFGAQGNGGRAAGHYVPGDSEINLTRKRGVGVLAHEWFHAMDNTIYTLTGFNGWANSKPYLSNLSGLPNEKRGLLPSGVYEACKQWSDRLMVAPQTLERWQQRCSTAIAQQRQRIERIVEPYLTKIAGGEALDRQAMENLCAALVNGEVGALKKIQGPGDGIIKTRSQMALYEGVIAVGHLLAKYQGGTISLRDLAGLQDGLHPYVKAVNMSRTLPPGSTVRSDYYQAALKLDAAERASSASYYATPWEMAARAFEAWVHDALDQLGQSNQYLVSPYVAVEAKKLYPAEFPYPDIADRAALRPLMDAFRDTLPRVFTLWSAPAIVENVSKQVADDAAEETPHSPWRESPDVMDFGF